MADEKQVELLKQGAADWNAWRDANSEVTIDLKDANLRNLNLRHVNLSRTNLYGADLAGADLRDAVIRETLITGANFSGAILRRSDLHGCQADGVCFYRADLVEADLSAAIMNSANLCEADLGLVKLNDSEFINADLREAILEGADLSRTDLGNANLSQAKLRGANLSGSGLLGADLSAADLREAILDGAEASYARFFQADLRNAKLRGGANFFHANFRDADCSGAEFTGSRLEHASLICTKLGNADLTGCRVYGAAVWDIETNDDTKQAGIIVTHDRDPVVLVDDLEVAQFIYLLLNREKLRNVINAMTQKGVLILGRFKDGGLEFLQAIATRVREKDYLPMLFDFEPGNQPRTDTVKTMVGLSRFVIADLSGPSVLAELTATVPSLKVPVVPIIQDSREYPSLSSDLDDYPWFHWPPVRFADQNALLNMLEDKVFAPAEKIAEEREKRRALLFPDTHS